MFARSIVCATCALAAGACRLAFDHTSVDASGDDAAVPPVYFYVGGTVSSPSVAGMVLQNNGADDLVITSPGVFEFPTPLLEGSSYSVTLKTSPVGLDCVLSQASGPAGVTSHDVGVTCFVAGTCPTSSIMFTADDTFTLPAGCSQITIEAFGGGGAGGGKNAGDAAAAGGAGGYAVKTLIGEPANSMYTIAIGRGGTCLSTTATLGGYEGGKGGTSSGFGDGGDGQGGVPPGGLGGAGSTGSQPGGAGGNGGYGGGGGGGGGDAVKGNSGGGATVVARVSGLTELVIAGGGGAAGASDQNGDRAGAGGNACNGLLGDNGQPAVAGMRSGGGGGGGGCYCNGGCNAAPTSTGGAGGAAGTSGGCMPAQAGTGGHVVLSF